MSTVPVPQSLPHALRLEDLGLEEQWLLQAAREALVARLSVTANHPVQAGGYYGWAEGNRALREALLPRGWSRLTDLGLDLTLSPDGSVAIAVSTGKDSTGLLGRAPSSQSPKGSRTGARVHANAVQLELFDRAVVPSNPAKLTSGCATWYLLIHFDDAIGEMRSELSLPVAIDAEGRLSGFVHRILLPSVPYDNDDVDVSYDGGDDIDFTVDRRA